MIRKTPLILPTRGPLCLLGLARRSDPPDDDPVPDRIRNAIYWMPADRSQPPRYLGEEHFEGIAVSRSSRKIAYFTSVPNTLGPSRLFVATIGEEGELLDETEVELPFEGLDRWRPLEAQDFFARDRGLIFSHYTQPAQTYSYDFETGELIDQTRSSAHEEPEGLFPDDGFAIAYSIGVGPATASHASGRFGGVEVIEFHECRDRSREGLRATR